jgi:integrase
MAKTGTKRGLGSIRKLPSGRYQLRYTDPHGLPQSAGTFQTKQLAEKRLGEIQFSIETGTWDQKQAIASGDIDPKSVTLMELAQHWQGTRLNRQGQPLRASTASEYTRLIQNVLTPLKDKPVRTITVGQVEAWFQPQQRKAPNQASKAYKHLNTLMKYALKRRWITTNPCDIDGAASYTPKRPQVPTDKQVQKMLETARDPFNVVIALAAWGGLRKGEIFALRRHDLIVDKSGGETWITVQVRRGVSWNRQEVAEGEPKSVNAVRDVLLPQRVTELLAKHLNGLPINADALLFPRKPGSNEPWREFQLKPHWDEVRALAGFQGRFHSLRAFALTQYGLTGATAAELMQRGGHRDIDTAMIYQRATGRERDLVRNLG